jgi:hypothetical protein
MLPDQHARFDAQGGLVHRMATNFTVPRIGSGIKKNYKAERQFTTCAANFFNPPRDLP